jgi:hypothetical protein
LTARRWWLIVLSVTASTLIVALPMALAFFLPFFMLEPVYAQQIINNSFAEEQKIGTHNILSPTDIHILLNNVQNVLLHQQFIVLGKNNTRHGTQSVAITNPDYTLPEINPTLKVGQTFRINSTTIQNTPESLYTEANVTLVPIASLPPNKNLSDIDPEDDLIQRTPIIPLGSYQGNIHNFVIPQVARPGYYLLYVSLYYPAEDDIMTVVYSILLRIVGG